MPEPVDHLTEPQIVGSEVVPPRRHAVRFIHDEQRHAERAQALDDVVLGELLGSEEEELGPARRDGVPRAGVRGVRLCRIHGDGLRCVPGGLESGDLVGLQGDEWRHDHGRPRSKRGGNLVDGRLPVSGRHDGEHVPARIRGHNGLQLAGSESRPAELLARNSLGLTRPGALHLYSPRRETSGSGACARGKPLRAW
jgi:hypothetical protein